MALQSITNINVDFYDKKYILINAKQFDRKSRFLSVTCYNHGEFYPLNEGEHSAYIRYKKADNNSVFNFCEIDRKGNITVELTEQMLAADGICCADLVIVNEGGAKVNTQTGEIINIENSSILSTMPLHIDVTGISVENSDIESSYEFNGLNTALEKAEAEYTEVMKTSKSWSVGGTGIRSGEDTDNSKYYSKQSSNSASASNTSALNAANSENLAEEHMHNALTYSQNAQTYMGNAKTYMNNASQSEANALKSEQNAKTSETNAKTSEVNSKTSETNANTYMKNAGQSATNASTSEANAKNAQVAAENAQAAAEVAQQKSEEAQSAAETAQDAAESARRNAEIAQQNAEKAASTAAQDTVNNTLSLMNDYVTVSQESATNAENSKQASATSEANAKVSETNASVSEANAKISEQAAADSATGAYTSEANAFTSEANASASEANALGYADISKSYAVGGTSIRENEDIDNAKYYYELANSIAENLNSNMATVDEVKEYLGI